MNLFDNIDRVKELDSKLSLYARDKGFNILYKEKNWHLFQRDELKIQIQFITRNNKDQIEFETPLFEEIASALEIFIQPIGCEKFIRDIAKTDAIGKFEDKIFLFRYVNNNENIYTKKTIIYNINSMLRRDRILQEKISKALDYTMFIKLN